MKLRKNIRIALVIGLIMFCGGMYQRAVDPFDYSHMPDLGRIEVGWENPTIYIGEFIFLLALLFIWAERDVEKDIKENSPERDFWTGQIKS